MSGYHRYVSIDIETTGLDENTCQVLEVGAVIDDWKSDIGSLPTFRCYVDNGTIVGEPYALSMHPKIFYFLATGEVLDGEPEEVPVFGPEDVAQQMLMWLVCNGLNPNEKKLTVAGKNYGAFDHQFLKRLPYFAGHIRMQHRYIDPGSLYFDPWSDDAPPNTATCMKRAGIEGEVAHTAVEDALTVVKLIRYWEEQKRNG